MEYKIRLNLATTAAVVVLGIAVSFVTSTVVAARAYTNRGDQISSEGKTITTKGSTCGKRIHSDRAVWSIRVTAEDEALPTAYDTLDTGVKQIRAFLTKRGFKPEEIGLGAIDTYVDQNQVRNSDDEIVSEVTTYLLKRTFTLTTTDVERVHQSAGEVTELIKQGVMVISCALEYYYSDLPKLKIELMGAASADARRRADEIANNAGCRVGEVSSARMGVLQITQPYSTEVSGYGIHDTTTVEKDVRAVVTATFQIEQS